MGQDGVVMEELDRAKVPSIDDGIISRCCSWYVANDALRRFAKYPGISFGRGVRIVLCSRALAEWVWFTSRFATVGFFALTILRMGFWQWPVSGAGLDLCNSERLGSRLLPGTIVTFGSSPEDLQCSSFEINWLETKVLCLLASWCSLFSTVEKLEPVKLSKLSWLERRFDRISYDDEGWAFRRVIWRRFWNQI